MSTTTASANKASASVESLADRVADATDAAAGVAKDVTDAAAGVAKDATEAATSVAREADRTLRGSPDEALAMLGALSVGMAVGMVATNAPRLLVAAALVPAAFVAWVYLQRTDMGVAGASR
ncbi:MAG: hypothetical protein R6W93_01170 [Candidatus Limnocylindrales bacterium]